MEIKRKRNLLNPNWIDSVLEKCEEAGVSKATVQRFKDYYIDRKGDTNEQPSTVVARTRRTND